jgi:hypothetical protein
MASPRGGHTGSCCCRATHDRDRMKVALSHASDCERGRRLAGKRLDCRLELVACRFRRSATSLTQFISTTSGTPWLIVRSSRSRRPSAATSKGDRATGITGTSAYTRGTSLSKLAPSVRTCARMMLRSSSEKRTPHVRHRSSAAGFRLNGHLPFRSRSVGRRRGLRKAHDEHFRPPGLG